MKPSTETLVKDAGQNGETQFEVARIREDFPILRQKVHGKPLVYLDNAATSQKPQVVIDALAKYYSSQNANIHRGVYALSELATYEYEKARGKVKLFLNAAETREIIFVRGTTEGINLVGAELRKKIHQSRRRGHHLSDGTSFEHCSVAAAV